MTDRELLELVEEGMKVNAHDSPEYIVCAALRTKLAQPEPEPVAHLWECLGRWSAMIAHDGEHADLSPPSWLCDAIKAATSPLQREWQGLTDEEIGDIADDENYGYMDVARAIQAKLKEKNG